MKNNVLYLLPAILFLLPACQREEVQPEDNDQTPGGPQMVSVTIDQETRATVSETTGLISFSSGDAIKIFNDSGIHTGVTASSSTSGMFSMEDGFSVGGSGFAGFPASMVGSMSTAGVKFVLPDTYIFSEVGGPEFNTSRVPCPMMGTVSGAGGIILQPSCAIVRFYVSDVKAGSLSFYFPTYVSGETVAIPTLGTNGITASSFSTAGKKTITVTGVPDVGKTQYICVTLPVPTGTVPGNIGVLNRPEDGSSLRYASIVGSSNGLARAGGHKLMVTSFTEFEPVYLGLSVKWATMNVGATSETDYGDYFAWGETTTKSNYDWPTYKWGTSASNLTKYNSSDGKTVLDLSDDAAHVNWGGGWRMPTIAEIEELRSLSSEWVSNYNNTGVAGYKFTATNGNSIFLPAAGLWYGTRRNFDGELGYYWSSSIDRADYALYFNFISGGANRGSGPRDYGHSVRPVLP